MRFLPCHNGPHTQDWWILETRGYWKIQVELLTPCWCTISLKSFKGYEEPKQLQVTEQRPKHGRSIEEILKCEEPWGNGGFIAPFLFTGYKLADQNSSTWIYALFVCKRRNDEELGHKAVNMGPDVKETQSSECSYPLFSHLPSQSHKAAHEQPRTKSIHL